MKVHEINPTRGRILVEDLEVGLYNLGGGLVMPATVQDWVPPQQGSVVRAGAGAEDLLGCQVLFGVGDGRKMIVEGRKMRILDIGDIIAWEGPVH